eukprot:TRINITY_DN27428_c0_g1_i1.p1 TRINITY_DN27428_c0_g1~~TRINITY_DN27428_c0_g1_i1.p1  ORF type:complete len:983 (-),score=197.88 TRINITY_DN27428_c0_g1_i1:9-2957(-)
MLNKSQSHSELDLFDTVQEAEPSRNSADDAVGTPTRKMSSIRGPLKGAEGTATDTIKVCVRVRPISQLELEGSSKLCVRIPLERPYSRTVHLFNTAFSNSSPKVFSFDRAYWSAEPRDEHFVSQEHVMQDLGVELKNNALEGYNNCLFAYGQTGSGKTYSVLGDADSPENRGLLPRICEDIFRTIKELEDDPTDASAFATSVSYLEIYNEQIRDLLALEERPKLDVRSHPQVGTYVQGLKDVPVFSWSEVADLLEFGTKQRAVASTVMNATSSRSHCIFTMEIARTITMPAGSSKQWLSKVNLVDLAGSERQKKTQATGERLKEGAMINQSLTALALVISKLAEYCRLAGQFSPKGPKQQNMFVPFRSSKLTHLLMDSLSGNSKTVMIAALSPAKSNYDETLSTLMFAQSVKAIKTSATKNERVEDQLKLELELECERLRSLVNSVEGQKHTTELAAMEELAAKYGRDFESQLKLAQSLKDQRRCLLDDGGLTSREMAESVGLEANTPQLLNVCYEPELAGCLVYFLPKGVECVIGSDKSNTIPLSGLAVLPKMAEICNVDDVHIQVRHLAGRVLLNGKALDGGQRALEDNDRIIVGHAFCFRLCIPAKVKTTPRTRRSSIQEMNHANDEIALETDRAYQACRFYAKELQARIGETRAEAFRKQFQKACRMVNEANEIARQIHAKERYEFNAEVLTDLVGHDCEVPECVIRLKKLPTGKARWREVVTRHLMNRRTRLWLETLSSLRMGCAVDLCHDKTVLLLSMDDFRYRMDFYRDAYNMVRASTLPEPEAFQELPRHMQDCWGAVQPWVAQEQALREATEKERDERLREMSVYDQCSALADLQEQLKALTQLCDAKDKRIEALEAAARDVSQAEDGAKGSRCNHQAPGSRTSATTAAQERLLSQFRDALVTHQQLQAKDTVSFKRHIRSLDDCNGHYFRKLQALRAEIGIASANETKVQEPDSSGTRGAMQLVDYCAARTH